MSKIFHRILGLLLLGVYVYFLFNSESLVPYLAEFGQPVPQVGFFKRCYGYYPVILMPIVPIICFLFGAWISKHYSSRSFLLYKARSSLLYTKGYYYLIGYIFLSILITLLFIFKNIN
jgi:hypothetical protein